ADFPNAYDMYSREITLPLHTLLTDEQVDYVADSLLRAIG
ncbi:MAG: DegT/DnrJ/EryC1/StrS family aminotransferase, partial [Oscillospiraceae bacterium]